jgi:hypothetical protein
MRTIMEVVVIMIISDTKGQENGSEIDGTPCCYTSKGRICWGLHGVERLRDIISADIWVEQAPLMPAKLPFKEHDRCCWSSQQF